MQPVPPEGLRFQARVEDGALIAWREWPGPAEGRHRLPAVCLPGLTRSSRSFLKLGPILAAERRVLAFDPRGRGESARSADPAAYRPMALLRDLSAAITAAGLERFVLIGVSLGGLFGLGLAAQRPTLLAGLVLNDVGPELDPAEVARNAGDAGTPPPQVASLEEAAAWLKRTSAAPPADWPDAEWLAHARTVFVERDGGWVVDYDPAIAKAATEGDRPDLWGLYQAAAGLPQLLVHGLTSRMLKPETIARMQGVARDLTLVPVAGWGHCPPLDQGPALPALQGFLARLDAAQP